MATCKPPNLLATGALARTNASTHSTHTFTCVHGLNIPTVDIISGVLDRPRSRIRSTSATCVWRVRESRCCGYRCTSRCSSCRRRSWRGENASRACLASAFAADWSWTVMSMPRRWRMRCAVVGSSQCVCAHRDTVQKDKPSQ